MSQAKQKIFIILHNLRSAANVGSIFRTADAAGAAKIYLTGYTPRPIDRFGRANRPIAKTALGAEQSVNWEYRKNIGSLIHRLKKEKIKIAAAEQDEKAIDYKKFELKTSAALVFGNEITGLNQPILKLADKIVEIPMRGRKESLNVAVAAGIIIFELLNQKKFRS